jgi:hypothetical protein
MTRFRPLSIAISVSLLLGFSGTAAAQSQTTSVRAMGMGDAFTAVATGTGALFHNPAGMSALMMYSVETSYMFDQQTGTNVLHASIVDGKSNPMLGGGFGYTYSTSSSEARSPEFVGHDLYGALSTPLVPGWVLFGATIHYVDYSRFDVDFAEGMTVDLGTLLALGDLVSLGVAVRNLLEIEHAGRPLEASFGFNYHAWGTQIGADFFMTFDGSSNEPVTGYAVGLEHMATEVIPVRVGYRDDDLNGGSLVSAGIGWRSDMAGVDMVFRQNLDASYARTLGLALDLYL